MSLSYGRIPTVDTILHATGGNIQKIYNLAGVPEFLKVAAAMTARRYHDAVQSSANPNPPTIAAQAYGNPPGVPVGAAGAPPAPSGGLGATPQAAPPMAPQMAAAGPQEAPMGMAAGGMVPPYAAGGGLSDVPVPDGMFDEPSNGGFGDGYAGGGLVAFGPGGEVSFEDDFDATFGTGPKPPAAPNYYGYSLDPRQNMNIARELMGTPESKYSGMLQQDLEETFNPDAIKKRSEARKGDLLLELATGLLANESPNFGVALGRAGARALTRAREVERLDKADRMFARKALADLEAGRNTQRAQLAAQAMQMQQMAIQGYEAETGRKFQATEKQKDRDFEWRVTQLKERGDNYRAGLRASGDGDGTGRGTTVTANRYSELQEKYIGATKDFNAAKAAWIRMGRPREDDKSPGRAAAARAYMDAADLRRDAADMWNNARLRGAPAPAKKTSSVTKGNGKLPAGVTQAEWNAMTPQERALFQ